MKNSLDSMDSTSAESIIQMIEDILLRLSLSLQNCYGQFHHRASSMAGCKIGVAPTILRNENKALYTYCNSLALNLAVQDAV